MPSYLDIYGLTHRRNIETINDFIDHYADRAASEDRGNEEISLVPLDGNTEGGHNYDWEPAISLTHMVERGLSQPLRAFTIYLKIPNIEYGGAVISFTSDEQLVLGVYIPMNYESEEGPDLAFEQAKKILETIAKEYDCHLGLIGEAIVPPSSEKEMREAPWGRLVDFSIKPLVYKRLPINSQ